MYNYSSILNSRSNQKQSFRRSLSKNSVGLFQKQALFKKPRQNYQDKNILVSNSSSNEGTYFKSESSNGTKRASVDNLKKSIYPSSKYTTHLNPTNFFENYPNEKMNFNLLQKNENNYINPKPKSYRSSLNLNSMSQTHDSNSVLELNKFYSLKNSQNSLECQNKSFWESRVRQKSLSRKNISEKQNIKNEKKVSPAKQSKIRQTCSPMKHTKHPSSYTNIFESFKKTNALKSKERIQIGQSYLQSPYKNQPSKIQKPLPSISKLAFSESQVDIDISSGSSIEENIQMTARFTPVPNETSQQKRIKQICTSLDNKVSQFHKQRISKSQFIIGPCKGRGRYGQVYMAIDRLTGIIVALKELSLDSIKQMFPQFINELKTQSFLNHPYIAKVYGFFIEKNHFYIIMEYMIEGNLYQLIKKSGCLSQIQAANKIHQVCTALTVMQNYSIIHRDLKPQNIVLSFGVAKICDFSWAVKCEERRQTNCGTLDYLSPQMIEGSTYSNQIDIWAIGVLLYELLVGKPPFYNISVKQTAKRIRQCKFSFPQKLSEISKNVIECFLKKDPEQRKSISEILKHPFFMSVQQ